jgi:4a-hydroxytetrahydrobiopterin dehydratase
MARVALPEQELQRRLSGVPDWSLVEGTLYRRFEFKDFVQAFSFMTAAALVAEAKNHHPDWRNVYRTVEVRLSTHDAGGITDLDFDLAQRLDALAAK